MMRISLLFFTVTAWGISCTPARFIRREAAPLLLRDTALKAAHVGIHVYDIGSAKKLYDYQGDKYFVPASNTKIFSCYAGLKYLGDSIPSIEFAGNDTALYIRPLGDPTILHPDYNWQPVIRMLQQTHKSVYLLLANWKTYPFGAGWSWGDYNAAYSAERSAFPVYGNVIKWVQERTGEAPQQDNVMDESVVIYSLPEVNWKVRFSTDTARKNFYVQREKTENIFTITQGHEMKGEQDVPFVTNGLQSAAALLSDTIGKPVGIFDKQLPDGLSFKNVRSQPVDALLQPMMFRSDNFFAEQILLMVSQQRFGVMDESLAIGHLLQKDLGDLPQPPRWVDGSGLSRYNLFTPQDFTTLLVKMKKEFGMERLKQLFPTGGVGTLQNYYRQDSSYLFAKTGSLSGVLALSGFMYTKKGRLLAFSVLVNNHRSDAGAIRRKVESFLKSIRQY